MPKMTRMISSSSHVYGGRALNAEEEFDAEDLHVQLLIVLGRARVKPQPEEPTYSTRALTARRTRRGKTLQ